MNKDKIEADSLTSTTRSSRSHHSTFTNLPFEIRLTIYKHYFSGQPRLITYPYIRPFDLIDERHWGLLLVSKDVYREALPAYYRYCIFGLMNLSPAHLEKLLKDTAHTQFAQHASSLIVWRTPEPSIFDTLKRVKWVKLLGITCGVEPDASNGQMFTYDSLIKALRTARAPGFSWARCQDLCSRYSNINFMVDFKSKYPEVKLDADGNQQSRRTSTNFVYDVRADVFVEETTSSHMQDALVLRPQTAIGASFRSHNVSRAFFPP